jgi:DNA-directed RNA polymerase specialized sigma24 family protein
MKREILNDKIETALKDPNIIALTRSVTNRYRKSLNEDEIKSCILSALSRSISNFDPCKNSKFTTYLHKGLKIECLTQIKKNKPLLKFSTKAMSKVDDKSETQMMIIEVMDEIDRLKDGHLVVDKYLNNYTAKEIAVKNDIHPETVRIKIKKTIESLRRKMK